MSTTYSFHPMIESGCLQHLVGLGFQLHRQEEGGSTVPLSPEEAIACGDVLLMGGSGWANCLRLHLDTIAGRSYLVSLTRYSLNGSGHALDAISDYAGDQVYFHCDSTVSDPWIPAGLATLLDGSVILFWRTAAAPIFPGEYPHRNLLDQLFNPEVVDPAHEAALARYVSERKAWLQPRLHPEDFLVADLETRRVSRPTGQRWAVIEELELADRLGAFHWILHLRESDSVVLLGERPLDWQRDEHDRLVRWMTARDAEETRRWFAALESASGITESRS